MPHNAPHTGPHITIMGNAIVDCLAHVEESTLTHYQINKGDFCHFEHEAFMDLHAQIPMETMQAGGASANTGWVLGKLGLNVNYLGRVGSDPAGRHFHSEMQNANVSMPAPEEGARTFEIFVLITPDGERSFAEPGTTAPLTPEWIDESAIKNSPWLLVEGYLLLDQIDAVKHAIAIAKQNKVKVALTLAPPFILNASKDLFFDVINLGVDLICSDLDEIETLTSLASGEVAEKLNSIARLTTKGPDGASYTDAQGNETHCATTPAEKVTDATGAGDTFLAGFLAEYLTSGDIKQGLENGHKLAGRVILQTGARLKNASPAMLQA